MTINTALLKTTDDLQQYLVDKDTGEALAAGVISLYKDSSRTTFKNWYYQSGTAGAYRYIALDNPLTLSASGTIVDPNGNDTLPFYFPFNESDNTVKEPYYITVDNSNGERQFVRQNFPFNPEGSSNSSITTNKNYIVNNNFWRNLSYIDLTNILSITVAPSQHDGFSLPDWVFVKDQVGSQDICQFERFDLGAPPFTGDTRPEFYLNHVCSSVGGTETSKHYECPIAYHIRNLDSVNATFTIQAKSSLSGSTSYIDIFILQFTGTGASVQPDQVKIARFNLTPEWKKYTVNFNFASASGLSVSEINDDGFYLRIGIPLGNPCNISFTLPSIYLCDEDDVPTNNMTTYDQQDAIINSPRTGDVRIAFNNWGSNLLYQNYGWVPAANGTIGNAGSVANIRQNSDCFQLYKLLWENTLQVWCPVSSGSRGSSAASDFIAGYTILLPEIMGKVLAGTATLDNDVTFTASINPGNLLTFSTSIFLLSGLPVQFYTSGGTLPTGLLAGTPYFVTGDGSLTATTCHLSTTVDKAIAGITDVVITVVGSGSNFISAALALVQGQSLSSEVPPHMHTLDDIGPQLLTGAGVNAEFWASGGGFTAYHLTPGLGTDMSGTNIAASPVTNIQPTIYANIYLKL